MNIKFHSPVLIVNDLETMKNFYLDVLNQEIDQDLGNCIILKCGLSLWRISNDYPIAGYLGRTYDDSGNKNFELCFETDDLKEVSIGLEKFKIKYLHEVIDEKWGQKTIRFYDPENNLVEIGETMKCFVQRLSKEGMTHDEINEKTSISIKMIKGYLDNL